MPKSKPPTRQQLEAALRGLSQELRKLPPPARRAITGHLKTIAGFYRSLFQIPIW